MLKAVAAKALAGDTLTCGLLSTGLPELLQRGGGGGGGGAGGGVSGGARLPTAVRAEWWAPSDAPGEWARAANASATVWSQEAGSGSALPAVTAVYRAVPQRGAILLALALGLAVSLRGLFNACAWASEDRDTYPQRRRGPAARKARRGVEAPKAAQQSPAGRRADWREIAGRLADVAAFAAAAAAAFCASHRAWDPRSGSLQRAELPAAAFALLSPVCSMLSCALPAGGSWWVFGALVGVGAGGGDLAWGRGGGGGGGEGEQLPRSASLEEESDVILYKALLSLSVVQSTCRLALLVILCVCRGRATRSSIPRVCGVM